MNPVKVLKNCISEQDANFISDYINTNLDSFDSGPLKLRFIKMFGTENSNKKMLSSVIRDIDEIESSVKNIINLSINSIRDEFEENKDLYLASLWITKQVSGAKIKAHRDTDNDEIDHYAYSAILYLNTPTQSSPLEFPYLKLEIMPELGDLVLFKSAEFESFHEVKHIGEDRYSIPMWFTTDKNYELKFAEK
jgi:Rps23 Pro-64 3,4-dihydroxylase Tpa1-like proline 4-hydroxylase